MIEKKPRPKNGPVPPCVVCYDRLDDYTCRCTPRDSLPKAMTNKPLQQKKFAAYVFTGQFLAFLGVVLVLYWIQLFIDRPNVREREAEFLMEEPVTCVTNDSYTVCRGDETKKLIYCPADTKFECSMHYLRTSPPLTRSINPYIRMDDDQEIRLDDDHYYYIFQRP